MIREFLGADEREWRRTESSFSLTRDRSTATVMVRVAAEGAELDLILEWLREAPETELTGHKICRRWYHLDESGGRWSAEYGYDGRWWVLFGPNGTPWGETLQRTAEDSLIEATEYLARQKAREQDRGQRAAVRDAD